MVDPTAPHPPTVAPGQTGPPEVSETHSAVVFFMGERAYKVRKPIDLGFLDFSTRVARQRASHREVELNSRMAPDVYLGVADVVGPDGTTCDHLVVMVRMPAPRRLATLVTEGAEVGEGLRSVAHQLAELHGASPRLTAADAAAGADATRARWSANTAEMRALAGDRLPAEAVEAVQDLAEEYLAGRGRLFEARVAAGRAGDGHGDLLADDIFLLPDGPRVLDCLEFADDLRLGDGLADAAFLAMDLERLGRADLAVGFLDAYARASGDSWPPSLAHHHIAYRAQVRAKVGAIRADQGDREAGRGARQLLEMCRRHLIDARVRLVVVGGLPGTGKSTLAAALATEIDAEVLRSDVVRKELAGMDPTQPAPAALGQGIYDDEATRATYRAMMDGAASRLAMGRSVVLDASFASAGWRRAGSDLAVSHHARFTELHCVAPREVAAERIRRRLQLGGDSSDADEEVARAMAVVSEPWAPGSDLDAGRSPAEVLAEALARLGVG